MARLELTDKSPVDALSLEGQGVMRNTLIESSLDQELSVNSQHTIKRPKEENHARACGDNRRDFLDRG